MRECPGSVRGTRRHDVWRISRASCSQNHAACISAEKFRSPRGLKDESLLIGVLAASHHVYILRVSAAPLGDETPVRMLLTVNINLLCYCAYEAGTRWRRV